MVSSARSTSFYHTVDVLKVEVGMKQAKVRPVLEAFKRRYADIQESGVTTGGGWELSSDPNSTRIPSRDQIIAHLGLFRQFFIQTRELVFIKTVLEAVLASESDQDLLQAIDEIKKRSDPFAFDFIVGVDGSKFDPKKLVEEWTSKYLHSDHMSSSLPDHNEPSWAFTIMPLALVFDHGSRVLTAIMTVILEGERRRNGADTSVPYLGEKGDKRIF